MQPSELRLIYDTGVSDGDPNDGRIRFDHARLSQARNIYVNQRDLDGAVLHELIPVFNLGDTVVIMRESPPTIVKTFITGPVLNRGPYYQIPIKVRSVEGNFTAGDALTMFRMGDVIDEHVPEPAAPSTRVETAMTIKTPDPKVKDLEDENASLKAALQHLLDDETPLVTVVEDK